MASNPVTLFGVNVPFLGTYVFAKIGVPAPPNNPNSQYLNQGTAPPLRVQGQTYAVNRERGHINDAPIPLLAWQKRSVSYQPQPYAAMGRMNQTYADIGGEAPGYTEPIPFVGISDWEGN